MNSPAAHTLKTVTHSNSTLPAVELPQLYVTFHAHSLRVLKLYPIPHRHSIPTNPKSPRFTISKIFHGDKNLLQRPLSSPLATPHSQSPHVTPIQGHPRHITSTHEVNFVQKKIIPKKRGLTELYD